MLVLHQVDFKWICEEVGTAAATTMAPLIKLLPHVSWVDNGPSECLPRGMLKRAEDVIAAEKSVMAYVSAALTSTKYLEAVCAAFAKAFASDSQLKRLQTSTLEDTQQF